MDAVFASILPGLRHVRPPLVAGYVWMLAVVYYLEAEHDEDVLDWIHGLGQTLTPVTVGIASGIAAYLIGSASQGVFGATGESGGVGGLLAYVFGSIWAWRLPRDAREATATGLFAPLSRSGLRRLRDWERPTGSPSMSTLSQRLDEARLKRKNLLRDLDRVRADLLINQPNLFAEVDRMRAEAEFRFVLAPPLLALVIALAVADGPAQSANWLFGLLLPVTLAVQGRDRLGRSNAWVVEALVRGLIEWPTWSLDEAREHGVHPFLDRAAPVAIAHRGGAEEAPENTVDAFKAAIELGYRYVETDVHLTRDGVLVAFHDARLDKITDRSGAISALTIDEVEAADAGYTFTPDHGVTFPFRGRGVRVPRLEDMLRRWPNARINIDPKASSCVEPLIELIDRLGAWDRVGIAAFSDRRLRSVRALSDGRACTAMGPRAVAVARLTSLLGRMPRQGADYLLVPLRWGRFPIVTKRFVRAAHRAGLPVHVWTIDDKATMHLLLGFGVDGIQTDRPRLLRDVFAARGLPLAQDDRPEPPAPS